MNCPACQRDNHPARRYCGGCGCNFAPACGSCGFANDHTDRYCGGCGQALRAGDHAAAHAAPPAAAAAPRSARLSTTLVPLPGAAPHAAGVGVWDLDELAELFTPAPVPEEPPDLPEVGISQNDVDRLFGSVP